ncbi:MAG TPA: hypothetical protein VFK05_26860 [Polyangiaceae bacterium]|nr:hypothetical protein [Polyangiaceae bacterium]
MKKLRSVGALLAISSVLSCATAINDEVPDSLPQTQFVAGASNNGGSPEPEGEGGAPAGGAPQQAAGTPGSGAGKVETGKGGSGSAGAGGKSGGVAGSTGKAGSGGGVGVGGSATGTGGSAGTGSSGAGESSGGSDGSAGGASTALCDNPKDVTGGPSGNTGNFDTLEAKCFRTKSTFNHVDCSNFQGRTLKVNGKTTTCGATGTFAPTADGYTYLEGSSGTNLSASIYWFTS